MSWNKDKTIIIVKSTKELDAIAEVLKGAKTLAIDTETTGIHTFNKAVGISFAPSEDYAVYIPLSVYTPKRGLYSPWSPAASFKIVEWLKAYVFCKELIGHNIAFDCRSINNTLGINIVDQVTHDTSLLHHLAISEEPPHSLKHLASLFLDPDAAAPKEEMQLSVVKNGGKWLAKDKEFYKADVELLGKYAAYDVLYTYGLYNRFMPALIEQGLEEMYLREVQPLTKVIYELGTTGFGVDVEHFIKLKQDILSNIKELEIKAYDIIKDEVLDYEYARVINSVTLTPRSELGKHLIANGYGLEAPPKKVVIEWFKTKKNIARVINLDSNVDKAYILFDLLKLPCTNKTKSGKPSVNASVLQELEEQYKESSELLQLILARAKETKLVSTYVEPIIEGSIDGRIYPNFNPIGTTSGRFSSSEPINFQTLPRDDLRIKRGFNSDKDYVFVNADFSSLEPRIFSHVSNSPELKEVYEKDLDLYSQVAIKMVGLVGVSANEKDDNYLKKIDNESRHLAKTITLAIPYGANAYRLSAIMKKTVEEAQELIDKYLKTFPTLKTFMKTSEYEMMKRGYVTNLVGRKKRAKLIQHLYKLGIRSFSKKELASKFDRLMRLVDIQKAGPFENSNAMYSQARNELNSCKNFKIQSLAASVCNMAMIDFINKRGSLRAKLALMVHDEITLLVHKDDANKAAELLQDCMENNYTTGLLSVKMKAVPIICTNLAEAK